MNDTTSDRKTALGVLLSRLALPILLCLCFGNSEHAAGQANEYVLGNAPVLTEPATPTNQFDSSSLPIASFAPTIALPSQSAYESAGQLFEGGTIGLAAADELATVDTLQLLPSWLQTVQVGYERGFVIASAAPGATEFNAAEAPFLLRLGGMGQLRETYFDSKNDSRDLNQFQLVRARLVLSGHAGTPELRYFVQLDGLSSAGEEFRLLDYFMEFDVGHRWFDRQRDALVFKAGRYKVPFSFARFMSSREFQFADRSVASMFFDLNRSLGWGVGGRTSVGEIPLQWEGSIFNGFITGGAETGSSGELDNNLAYSFQTFCFPLGDWGADSLSDFEQHESLAVRLGSGFAATTIERNGPTEFNIVRVVDSGAQLGSLLPATVNSYNVHTFSTLASCKYQGWSATYEYYLRNIGGFEGAALPDLFDHGFWFQTGKFVIPRKLQLVSRWSRVVGSSGTLGGVDESADEVAGGAVWYFQHHNAKLTFDATHLNGAPINSPALDVSPGAAGWLFRTQIQFAF